MTQRRTTGSARRATSYPESAHSSRPAYDHYAPGVGYTPPYPPPPKGFYGRGRGMQRRYMELRQRARTDSMAWWYVKVLQGLLLSCLPFSLGGLIILANRLFDGNGWLEWAGVGLLLSGLLIVFYHVLAPVTGKWIVTVPENGASVVEDANGYTIEYLEPGRWRVPWHWNTKVREYVDFTIVTANALVADIFGGNGPVVDIDVTVAMVFNPALAESSARAQLRKMTTRDHFETMITRDVRDIVRKHFRLLTPDQQRNALTSSHVLEEIVAEQLAHCRSLGLTLASGRPVMVYVRNLPMLPSYYPPVNAWQNPPAESQHNEPSGYVTPNAVRAHKPADETENDHPTSTPFSNEDVKTVKEAKNAQDPLTLRRRRRDRWKDY